jgi:Chalcone and stilbene synthases, N-terminal domain
MLDEPTLDSTDIISPQKLGSQLREPVAQAAFRTKEVLSKAVPRPSRRWRGDHERRNVLCKQHTSIVSRQRCRPMTFMTPFAALRGCCLTTAVAISCSFSARPISRGSSAAIRASRQAICRKVNASMPKASIRAAISPTRRCGCSGSNSTRRRWRKPRSIVCSLERGVRPHHRSADNCCTGLSAPGLDLELIERCRLPSTVERTTIGFMGCYAAINALKLARHIVRSEAFARVLTSSFAPCT